MNESKDPRKTFGEALVAAAEKDGRTLIAVLFGGDLGTRRNDSSTSERYQKVCQKAADLVPSGQGDAPDGK